MNRNPQLNDYLVVINDQKKIEDRLTHSTSVARKFLHKNPAPGRITSKLETLAHRWFLQGYRAHLRQETPEVGDQPQDLP